MAGIRVGLRMSEIDGLEIGELLDIIITFNNESDNEDKQQVRNATQADFDRF